MITPRDKPIHFALVDFETGEEIDELKERHLRAITAAGEVLYAAMHDAEGSAQPGDHQEHLYQSPTMQRASIFLEVALMLARKAAIK